MSKIWPDLNKAEHEAWLKANPNKVRLGIGRAAPKTRKRKKSQRTIDAARVREAAPKPNRPRPDLCELCFNPQKKRLALDHDHKTGKFRGWLCASCNLGIGLLGDTEERIRKAWLYLVKADKWPQ